MTPKTFQFCIPSDSEGPGSAAVSGKIDRDGDASFDRGATNYFSAPMLRAFATMLEEMADDIQADLAADEASSDHWSYEV
jgi:hypothetical protein